MHTDKYKTLISRLSLQVTSFQEGFRILAKAFSLRELGKNFNHILRGSLMLVDLNIFYKKSMASEWEEIYVYNKNSNEFLKDLQLSDIYSLSPCEDKPYKLKICLPLNDGAYFGLFLGKKLDKTEYSEIDTVVLQIFLQLLDNGYQAFMNQKREKELIFSLNNRVVQLNSLIDTGIEISKLTNTKNLLVLALERAASLTNASYGIIEIITNQKKAGVISFPLGISVDEVKNSEYKIQKEVQYQKRKFLVTLANKESRSGYIPFDETDEIILTAFARQVFSAIENDHLHKEAIEKENIQRELAVASSIQKKIIPEELPQIEGYGIAGINIPTKEVGGDYYDVIPMSDGRYALIMADVAGKGVPASLLVSTLNASLQAYLDMHVAPAELAVKINSIIYKASTLDKFITFFMAVLNPETGELDVINAGHNPSLLLKNDGSLQKIEAGGVAFGMFDMGLPFAGEKLTMKKGERLLLYTDGIPEAMTIDEEEYSDERMESFFMNNTPENAQTFINDIVNDVKTFTGGAPQSDDITALYMIRK